MMILVYFKKPELAENHHSLITVLITDNLCINYSKLYVKIIDKSCHTITVKLNTCILVGIDNIGDVKIRLYLQRNIFQNKTNRIFRFLPYNLPVFLGFFLVFFYRRCIGCKTNRNKMHRKCSHKEIFTII